MWRASRSSSTSRKSSPAFGDAAPAEDLHRLGLGPACFTGCPFSSCIARIFANAVPRHERVADVERALLHEHGGDRAAALVQVRLDHGAARATGRVALQLLEVGDEQDRLEEAVEVASCLRRDVDELVRRRPTRTARCRAPPSACGRAWGRPPSLSTLFTATMIGTAAAFAWSSASTVCGITPSSAATTRTAMSVTCAPRARIAVNASWPGVSMNVISRSPTWAWYAPMCCVMPAELPGDDVGLADRVQQLGLAVVDVAHDRHDRRPRHERGLVDLLLGLVVELVLDPDDLGVVAELGGDQRDRLVRQRRRGRRHLAGR